MTKSENRKIFLGARRVDEVEEAKNIFRELVVVRSRDEQKVFFGAHRQTRETEMIAELEKLK